MFLDVLQRSSRLFSGHDQPTLCHDDLHHRNLLFEASVTGPRVTAVLDWDKAWSGPAESDVARLAMWDDMTGPGFWSVYRAEHPPGDGEDVRRLIYQLLWCFEYDAKTARHREDTRRVCHLLGLLC